MDNLHDVTVIFLMLKRGSSSGELSRNGNFQETETFKKWEIETVNQTGHVGKNFQGGHVDVTCW